MQYYAPHKIRGLVEGDTTHFGLSGSFLVGVAREGVGGLGRGRGKLLVKGEFRLAGESGNGRGEMGWFGVLGPELPGFPRGGGGGGDITGPTT
jgi:hypothetical protein